MRIALAAVSLAVLAAACQPAAEEAATPATPAATPEVAAPVTPPPVEAKDIVDTAVGAGTFGTLVAAVQAAGLEQTLRGAGPFTVFAPTDAAFAALPAGTVENLLKPENKAQLTAVLTYHVIPGEVMSTAITDAGTDAATVNGKTVKVMLKDGKAMVNDATVTAADVKASNGVIHVIDKVILPPQ
jgi:uncharacterized surface protein with fasciclin (FAS1) repeats